MAFQASANENLALCNSAVKPSDQGELSYKMRGNRCEGLFAQKVSATGIRIVAFHNHPISFESDALTMRIISDNKENVKNLTVSSLRNKIYYRMDTVYAGLNFDLSLDIIRHPEINMQPYDLAALICKQDCDGLTPTFIPASFVDNKKNRPHVTLMANLDILELNVLIKDQATGQVLFDQEIIGDRVWPARKAATFPLKDYLQGRKEIIFEVIAIGRGNTLIDSISARLQSK